MSSLIVSSDEPAGDNCPAGGLKIEIGPDENANGRLDADEIESTDYVCSGSQGSDGLQTLVVVTAEPAGETCAAGGQRIDYGIDDSRDGVLDTDEIDGTTYACDGTEGLQSLVATSPVAASFDCPVGGQGIDYGIDDNGDGVLDPEEIDGNAVVCVGACQSAPYAVTKDFFFLATGSTASLDQDEVTITGTPGDVHMLLVNGLGVVGGLFDNDVDTNESLTYTFDRPALNVSYNVNAVGNLDGDTTLGDAVIEAFGADGTSLGTANVDDIGDKDVSQLFGGAPITSFEVTADGDNHRVRSLTFTTCD